MELEREYYMYSKQASPGNEYHEMADKSPFGDLELDERYDPDESIADIDEDRGSSLEPVEFQIMQTQKALEELNTQLKQMVAKKSRWFELAKVELEISNKAQELEYFESVKLGMLRSQSNEKENELALMRDRNERLGQYQEQVNDIDRNNGMDDRSPFGG